MPNIYDIPAWQPSVENRFKNLQAGGVNLQDIDEAGYRGFKRSQGRGIPSYQRASEPELRREYQNTLMDFIPAWSSTIDPLTNPEDWYLANSQFKWGTGDNLSFSGYRHALLARQKYGEFPLAPGEDPLHPRQP